MAKIAWRRGENLRILASATWRGISISAPPSWHAAYGIIGADGIARRAYDVLALIAALALKRRVSRRAGALSEWRRR
jgi:hypothetical protein